MSEITTLLLVCLGWLAVLLIMYIVLFRVYYHSENNRPWWLWPAAVVFVVLDFLVNLIPMSILMLDLPREFLVTARMKRYKASNKNRDKGLHRYHYLVAHNLCLILNLFDKEGHC